MNYQFTIQKMKSLATSLIVFFVIPVCGQKSVNNSLKMYYQDSLIINKNFKERSVSNKLTVKVINLCDSEKERFDGAVTIISAAVKNKKYSDSIVYNYPYAQSGLINLKANNISNYNINKHQAILIPFTYCGNWDNDTKVSYIILYNHKKYLYHIKYYCGEDGKCKLNDNLNTTLKDLPLTLRLRLRLKINKDPETKYNNSNNFQ